MIFPLHPRGQHGVPPPGVRALFYRSICLPDAGRLAELRDSMYLVTKMITQFSRFSFMFRYWRTVAASAE